MTTKGTRRKFKPEFKKDAVALVSEQGYSISKAAEAVGTTANNLRRWIKELEQEESGVRLDSGERAELDQLRREVKQLRMEKEIPKKGQRLLCERNEIKYEFIKKQQGSFPVRVLCRVMQVNKSSYYEWCRRSDSPIDGQIWQLCHRLKALFAESRESLGSRRLMKLLRKEGFEIGRYRVRKLMKKLGLVVKQKKRFTLTTNSKHQLPVAENLLNRDFSPSAKNQVWTTDITYIWTLQGWLYLAVVIDLYSRRIVGWHLDRQMETALASRALVMAINLRTPTKGLLHHSDLGSQYASHSYQALLKQHGMVCSMSRKGNCWDNAPTERFFSSLKREWLTGNLYPTREGAITDVRAYIAYYNSRRIHTTLGDVTPIEFEKCA
ncbi:IS3 family transposase [Microbulbifer sp. VAAF005]|uniref:IS3 family transposase n=1 Tax=Microbulbifer sp. VAAF005 TaxID=3034230 RepID=UPI0024AE6416|nr:IS3 family transposase [Microbulbifer sp. VAAF005]WHI45265.1 IS3 family transposase [Microbulbifer sp. VAAF005]